MTALSAAVTPQSLSPPPISTRPSAMLTSISLSPATALMWVCIKSSILLRVTQIEVEFYPYQVVRAKIALELACPGVVSCADIIVVAARNLVLMIGGPYYTVNLGRKDSLTSTAYTVDGNLPKPTMPMNQIIQIFQSRGFSVQEMMALSGAHTIGFSYCKEFNSTLYNYSKTSESAPSYNPRFSQALRNACANYNQNPTLSVFNDVMSPNKFDNMYFQNLPKGLGEAPWYWDENGKY
ncbi:Peroxidase 63 [Abeliophyllum distichum]|uniref:peroxidase n=1 Tax=Abeliophyllum distichum TaxID=126358 RepID=A0ABD1UL01_9LAMI